MAATHTGFWGRHLDQVGVAGSVLAALCCLGIPAVVTILSAIGLGFLVSDRVLLPLLAAMLLVTLIGLYLGMRRHGHPWALLLGVASSLTLVASLMIWFHRHAAWAGVLGLVSASLANAWLGRRSR